MTADNFVTLFVAFTAFVIAPAILLWGFARFRKKQRRGRRRSARRESIDELKRRAKSDAAPRQ